MVILFLGTIAALVMLILPAGRAELDPPISDKFVHDCTVKIAKSCGLAVANTVLLDNSTVSTSCLLPPGEIYVSPCVIKQCVQVHCLSSFGTWF